jgi:hypothetical protein
MHSGYVWHTNTIRLTTKTPKPKHGDWLRCGAHCKRTGRPCWTRALKNGRCKYRSGLSTGPKSPEGKGRALANLKLFKRRRYLRQIDTSIIYVYTDLLAQRHDMAPCE